MLGEHRPALSDLLWERAQVILKSFQSEGKLNDSQPGETTQITPINNEEIAKIQKYFKEFKTPDDILVRAKNILRRYTDQNSAIIKI